jgi:hypothetical protein
MSAEKYLECPECKGSGEADRIEHDSVPCGACNGKGSAEKYELCLKAGLSVRSRQLNQDDDTWSAPYVLAADVERLLESAPVVHGLIEERSMGLALRSNLDRGPIDTHTARLLLIEPIVRDTPESLLRELIRAAEVWGFRRAVRSYRTHVVTRARRLLERK